MVDRPNARPTGGGNGATQVAVTFPITLGQFLKASGLVSTGGEAKYVIVEGMVEVNGEIDMRRGRKLAPGDVVALGETEAVVASSGDSASDRPAPDLSQSE